MWVNGQTLKVCCCDHCSITQDMLSASIKKLCQCSIDRLATDLYLFKSKSTLAACSSSPTELLEDERLLLRLSGLRLLCCLFGGSAASVAGFSGPSVVDLGGSGAAGTDDLPHKQRMVAPAFCALGPCGLFCFKLSAQESRWRGAGSTTVMCNQAEHSVSRVGSPSKSRTHISQSRPWRWRGPGARRGQSQSE